jgi:hypothetical protein
MIPQDLNIIEMNDNFNFSVNPQGKAVGRILFQEINLPRFGTFFKTIDGSIIMVHQIIFIDGIFFFAYLKINPIVFNR